MRRRPADPSPILVVGLGNPGAQYEGTRHNVGAEVAEALAGPEGLGKGPRRVRAQIARVDFGGRPCIVARPATFMNVSGEAVSALVAYYKVAPPDLVVAHDDIDLPFSRLRFHGGRGAGGNLGVASIIRSLRSNEFWRVRIGVGRPPGRMDPADFVLRRFSRDERPIVDLMVREAADVVRAWIEAGAEVAKEAAAEATKRLVG